MSRIFVGSLPPDSTEEMLEKHFAPVGRISKVTLKGSYAFLDYEDAQANEKAIESLHGSMLAGHKIVVEPSRRSDSKCYLCQEGGHWAKDCPKKESGQTPEGRTSPTKPRTCFFCGENGHYARECTKKKEGGSNGAGDYRGGRDGQRRDRHHQNNNSSNNNNINNNNNHNRDHRDHYNRDRDRDRDRERERDRDSRDRDYDRSSRSPPRYGRMPPPPQVLGVPVAPPGYPSILPPLASAYGPAIDWRYPYPPPPIYAARDPRFDPRYAGYDSRRSPPRGRYGDYSEGGSSHNRRGRSRSRSRSPPPNNGGNRGRGRNRF